MKLIRLAGALAAALLTTVVFAQTGTSDDAIASQFFPDSLPVNPDLNIRQWNLTRADFAGIGRDDYLVVVYYNGEGNVLRVLHEQNGNTILVAEPDLPPLPLALGTVERCEVDGDPAPEIFLRVLGDRTSQDFVLDWRNGLHIVSPYTLSALGNVRTSFSNIYLADIDGDGRAEALVPNLDREKPSVITAYRFANGGFAAAGEVPFHYRLERTTGSQNLLEMDVPVVTPGRYLLRVVNGDPGKNNQATSAQVTINGATVLSESSFKKKERLLTATVTLGAVNRVRIELRGAPGTALSSISLTQVP